jgi:hypothetical protein
VPRGEPRQLVAFRLSANGKGWLDDLVAVHGATDRTDAFRAVMAVAKNHENEVKALIKQNKEQR